MGDLNTEVTRFREWAIAYPSDRRSGEWECDYEHWLALWTAVFEFVDKRPLASWTETELQGVLYSIARDNEFQYIAREIGKQHPELVIPLAHECLRNGERDNRWQFAIELANLGANLEVERVLLAMADDVDEYVRRVALQSLLRIGSPAVEELALSAWKRPDEDQEWSRMMALSCLQKLNSRFLGPLIAEAEQDTRENLRAYALRIRQEFNPTLPCGHDS